MDGQIQGQGSEIEWFHDESASIKQGLLGGLFGVETTNWIGEESCILGIVNVWIGLVGAALFLRR